jgi:uncharacterized protein YhaN
MAALRNANHDARRRLAERARETAITTLTDRLRTLHPWRGEADDLVGMRCPGGNAIQQWRTALDDAQRELRRHVSDVERLTSEIHRLEAERDAITGITGIVSDQEAAAIRTRREQAWSAHRHDLEVTSADAFENALRHDDIVTSSRQTHMSELAKLHQNGQSLTIAAAELRRATQLKDAGASALQSIRDEIAAAVSTTMSALFSVDVTLTDLEGWVSLREKALEARDAVVTAERDLREANADAQEAHERLKAAFDGAGLPYGSESGFDGLLTAARLILDREGEARALRSAADERKRELVQRERAAEQATADEQAWTASWAKACKACWLGDQVEIPTLATVREILSAAADLGPALEKKAGLVDRIEKMQKDQVAFREEVVAICCEMAVPVGSHSVLDLAQRVGDRVLDAVAARLSKPLEGRDHVCVRWQGSDRRDGPLGGVLVQCDAVVLGHHPQACSSDVAEVAVTIRDGGHQRILEHGREPERKQFRAAAQSLANTLLEARQVQERLVHVEQDHFGLCHFRVSFSLPPTRWLCVPKIRFCNIGDEGAFLL